MWRFASLVPVAAGAALLAAHVTVGGVLSMGALMAAFLLLLLVVAAYLALFSAFSSDRGRAAGLAGRLCLAFYLAWVISRLSPDWSWLGRLSIFTAYEPQRALETGGVDLVRMALLLCSAAGVAVVALVGFKRRDVLA